MTNRLKTGSALPIPSASLLLLHLHSAACFAPPPLRVPLGLRQYLHMGALRMGAVPIVVSASDVHARRYPSLHQESPFAMALPANTDMRGISWHDYCA